MCLRVRILAKHLPIDSKTYEELGRVVHRLAMFGAREIEFADNEGIILAFPDSLMISINKTQIEDLIKDIKKLEIHVEEEK